MSESFPVSLAEAGRRLALPTEQAQILVTAGHLQLTIDGIHDFNRSALGGVNSLQVISAAGATADPRGANDAGFRVTMSDGRSANFVYIGDLANEVRLDVSRRQASDLQKV